MSCDAGFDEDGDDDETRRYHGIPCTHLTNGIMEETNAIDLTNRAIYSEFIVYFVTTSINSIMVASSIRGKVVNAVILHLA